MDNITHTLVGACLAEAGLKRRTPLGSATLMIGANFPDIDVVAVPMGMGIEWRRGITHGFPALVILPFVLAAIMRLWDVHVRRPREPDARPADFRQLVLLSALAIATHPSLDFMNTYGMRWLMPFVDRWYYADGLFIVDVWLMMALTVGMWWSRRTDDPRPARGALGFLAAYTCLMLAITSAGRAAAARQFPGRRVAVQPQAVLPWRRDVLVDDGDLYRFGEYRLFGRVAEVSPPTPKGVDPTLVARLEARPDLTGFLGWARFPIYQVRRAGDSTLVIITDARYGGEWATKRVTLP